MSQISDYLEKLADERDRLAANLTLMGVNASEDEALDTLIPKVLDILVGDTSKEAFSASISPSRYPEGRIIKRGELCSVSPLIHISMWCQISTLSLRLTGHYDLSPISVQAPGWDVDTDSSSGIVTSITITKIIDRPINQFGAMALIDAVKISTSDPIQVTLTMTATGSVDGTDYVAEGSCDIGLAMATWAMIEATYPTWGATEGKTWEEIGDLIT